MYIYVSLSSNSYTVYKTDYCKTNIPVVRQPEINPLNSFMCWSFPSIGGVYLLKIKISIAAVLKFEYNRLHHDAALCICKQYLSGTLKSFRHLRLVTWHHQSGAAEWYFRMKSSRLQSVSWLMAVWWTLKQPAKAHLLWQQQSKAALLGQFVRLFYVHPSVYLQCFSFACAGTGSTTCIFRLKLDWLGPVTWFICTYIYVWAVWYGDLIFLIYPINLWNLHYQTWSVTSCSICKYVFGSRFQGANCFANAWCF